MNYKVVIHTLGYVLATEAALLLLPLGVSFIYQDGCSMAFALTIALVGLCSIAAIGVKPTNKVFYARDGFVIVSLSWVLMSLFGAIPFWLSAAIPSYVDAFFETVSGFTTTGASILNNVEALSHSLLFWRSFTHWIGGMGVLVFVLAVLPMANDHSRHLIRAEMPGPSVGKLVPKMQRTAIILYLLYIALTFLQIIFLLLGDMPFFDSLLTAFGTAGTGGFGVKNNSIAFYNSSYIDGVITVFMLLFGINFNLYYYLLLRDFEHVFKNEELWWYLGIALGAMGLITLNILSLTNGLGQAFRLASFQVASVMTTTGFSTTDFNLWPTFSKFILMLLMLIGASGGSTGGGVKVSRIIILVKKAYNSLLQMLFPRYVRPLKMDGKRVDDDTINNTQVFFIAYIFLFLLCGLVVSLDGFDMETTLTSVLACFSNIGPGFGVVGPMGNFSLLSNLSKLVLSAAMLLGRLEIFPLLLLLFPKTWAPSRK